jgi:8-oxo-dGTP pyrophosphatase MutT (NUDIX family)
VHIVGVSAVLSNSLGEVLLVRTAKAGWELPGGRVEPGEELLDALRREIIEESGCTAELGQLSGVYAHAGRGLLMLVFTGTSHTAQPAPQPGETKVLEAAWFSAAEALHRVPHPRAHTCWAAALAKQAAAIYRAYP